MVTYEVLILIAIFTFSSGLITGYTLKALGDKK